MARIVLCILVLATAGCVSVDGGAVEASWQLETRDGRVIADCGCACPQISQVRFSVVPRAGGADLCAGRDACRFPCRAQHGATPFDVAPGDYVISLVPVDANGQDLGAGDGCSTALGAPPALRSVKNGQLAQLDAMVILADCAPVCGGADNTHVCTK